MGLPPMAEYRRERGVSGVHCRASRSRDRVDDSARGLESASKLGKKTAALGYLAVFAAVRVESGIPIHARLAKQAGARRDEIISAALTAYDESQRLSMKKWSRRDVTALGLSTFVVGPTRMVAHHIRLDTRADIVIRPFAPTDAEAVGRLVDAEYLNDADRASSLHAINRDLHLPTARGSDWRTTLVAANAAEVVGVGSAKALALGLSARTHVIVAPSHRRQGIGTRLYRSIAPLVRADGRTPVASIAAREGIAFRFASSCGMKPLMRSRQLTLDLTSWTVDLWCRHAVQLPSPYPIVPSARVAPDVFFGALGAAYHYMHQRWSDIQIETPAQYRATWMGRVSETSGVVALEGQQAVGVGNYFANGAVDAGVVVFPTGVCRELPSLDHERALTARLLGDRLLAARTAGNREAILEFDDDDGRLLSVIASIPVSSINESFTLTAGPTSHWPSRP